MDVRAWLVPETIAFETDEALEEYILTPYLRPATGLPEPELRAPRPSARPRACRRGRIDYVRLERPGAPGLSVPPRATKSPRCMPAQILQAAAFGYAFR